MSNIKLELYEKCIIKDYDGYFKLFDEYIKSGYGVDFGMIHVFINSLAKCRRFDEAYKLTQHVEKYSDKYNLYEELARLYYHCFKPKDAERMILKVKDSIEDLNLLANIYLIQGKIEQARDIIKRNIKINPNDTKTKEINKIINNYYDYGAFVEIDYDSFLELGNNLESGHIVYLKNNPLSLHNLDDDDKIKNRPYMIWKIVNSRIYIFPVTSRCKDKGYKLYYQKYPNSIGDRSIKSNLCYTTLDNILTITDKVLEEDYRRIITSLYKCMYFGFDEKDKDAANYFLKDVIGIPNIHDIIEIASHDKKYYNFYFVIGINDIGYETVKINFDNCDIISDDIEIIDKNSNIYKIRKVDSDTKNKLLARTYNLVNNLNDYDIETKKVKINK